MPAARSADAPGAVMHDEMTEEELVRIGATNAGQTAHTLNRIEAPEASQSIKTICQTCLTTLALMGEGLPFSQQYKTAFRPCVC